MTLYIVTHSWNATGYEHGAKAEVFKTREEAQIRMNAAKEEFEEMIADNEDEYDYWFNDTEIELYDTEDSSNFDRYELTEETIEL